MHSASAPASRESAEIQVRIFDPPAKPTRGAAAAFSDATVCRSHADAARAGSSPYLVSRRKRVLDLAGATTLLLLLLPLLMLVALLIRATSKGSILFRQTRCGAGGQPFSIYKFRSMYEFGDRPEVVLQASRGDARITPIGRFIRRTSIDELPQLVNVLQGHMSLIGPRPHATSHDVYYGARIVRYGDRFSARPGLSGLAQVSGARGETPLLSDMERRIEFDLAYIHSASLKTDLRLLAATLRETVFSSTAY